jgi:hypothetical protein
MRLSCAAAIAVTVLASATWAAPQSGETELSRLVGEREAGKPIDCLLLRRVKYSRIIDGTAIIFEADGTLYLNRPTAGSELLDDDKAIMTSAPSAQICNGEAVQLFDAASGVISGSVFLGRFIPYTNKRPTAAPLYQAPANRYW